MSEVVSSRFTCDGCGKSHTWKPELALKRVKCKCGQVMIVPPAPPGMSPQEESDLYDLAPPMEEAPQTAPRVPLAPKSPKAAKVPLAPRSSSGGATSMAAVAAVPRGPASPILGYQHGPTQREKDRVSTSTLLDMNRDVYVPVALLICGLALYLFYFAMRGGMTAGGLAIFAAGISATVAFKAVLMIGFALVVASPLGVSFGGIWTASLKLAAVAIFCDGAITWTNAGVAKMAGASLSGFISFPIALAIYWLLLIYLFSMDSEDSWMVVVLLAVFDFIVRWALVFLVMATILSWGGAPPAVATAIGAGTGAVTTASKLTDAVNEMKDNNQLEEARKFIKTTGRQKVLTDWVDGWYTAGCANVWVAVDRDINGRMTPDFVIVELPKDKTKRPKCYELLDGYYKGIGIDPMPGEMTDTGEQYMEVRIRG